MGRRKDFRFFRSSDRFTDTILRKPDAVAAEPESALEVRLALAENALEDLRHRARNDRQATALIVSEFEHHRRELNRCQREIAVLRGKLYAGLSVALTLGPLFAWVFDALR